jgi:hypothetical protein
MNHYDLARQRERRFVLAVAALLVILVLALVAYSLKRMPRQAALPNMLLVQSGREQQAPNVGGAPAVTATQIDQRLKDAAATTGGEVEVSLAWNSASDLDIRVADPSGELITAAHRHSASGGVQDVDANPTWINAEGERRLAAGQKPGAENVLPVPDALFDLDRQTGLPAGLRELLTLPGSDGKAPSRFTRTPVEHIFFARAPKGTYTVYAHCYSWREPNSNPLPFTVQVRSHGRVFHETSGTLGPASFVTHDTTPTQVCQFVIR